MLQGVKCAGKMLAYCVNREEDKMDGACSTNGGEEESL
jgi:hypothetical protein